MGRSDIKSLWLLSGENTEGGQVEGGRGQVEGPGGRREMTGGQGYSFSRYSSGVLYGPDTVTDTRDSSVKETASQAELSLFSSRGSQTNSNAQNRGQRS